MAENKGYMTLSDEQGSIHISEEVIVTSGLANNFIPDEKSSYTYTFAN